MYDIVTTKFRWAGIDEDQNGEKYWDETIQRMVTTTRSTMTELALQLIDENKFDKARVILDLMVEKLPAKAVPYSIQMGQRVAQAYALLGEDSGSTEDTAKAKTILENEIKRYAGYITFYQSLDNSDYRRLTNNDQYIDQFYLMDLINLYGIIASDEESQALLENIQAQGVNFERQIQFMKAREEQYGE